MAMLFMLASTAARAHSHTHTCEIGLMSGCLFFGTLVQLVPIAITTQRHRAQRNAEAVAMAVREWGRTCERCVHGEPEHDGIEVRNEADESCAGHFH